MAQSQIRVPSIEELKAAAQNRQATFDPAAMTKGFAQGMTLEDTIAAKSLERQKAEEDLKKEIMAAKVQAQQSQARNTFIEAAKKPVSLNKTVQAPVPTATPVAPMAPVADPMTGQMSIPQGPAMPQAAPMTMAHPNMGNVQVPRSQEEMIQAEAAKAADLKNQAIGMYPDVYAKGVMDTGTAKRYQQGTAEVNGQVQNVVFDTTTGQYLNGSGAPIKGSTIRGYKAAVQMDPLTEQLIRITSAGMQTPMGLPQPVQKDSQGQVVEVTDPSDLTIRQSNKINELRKGFEDDEVVKTARLSMATINNLKTLQDLGYGALIGSLQSLRARGLAGEKGVLTEKDVERTTGSPQLARKWSNALSKMLIGKENPENIAEFKSALAEVENAAANRAKQVEESYIQRAKATKELQYVSPALISQNIGIGTTPFATSASGARKSSKGYTYTVGQ